MLASCPRAIKYPQSIVWADAYQKKKLIYRKKPVFIYRFILTYVRQ